MTRENTDRRPVSVTRSWTDANDNFSPDCNLLDLRQQDLRPGGDFCGTVSDLNFGSPNPSVKYDPELLGGWGVRPGDWQFAASVQQEVLRRVSVEAGYYRRWLVNFPVEDNLAVTPADFDTYSVRVPDDPRLPTAGQTISGLYDVKGTKFGQAEKRAMLGFQPVQPCRLPGPPCRGCGPLRQVQDMEGVRPPGGLKLPPGREVLQAVLAHRL